jgi:hypothetical protein
LPEPSHALLGPPDVELDAEDPLELLDELELEALELLEVEPLEEPFEELEAALVLEDDTLDEPEEALELLDVEALEELAAFEEPPLELTVAPSLDDEVAPPRPPDVVLEWFEEEPQAVSDRPSATRIEERVRRGKRARLARRTQRTKAPFRSHRPVVHSSWSAGGGRHASQMTVPGITQSVSATRIVV